MILENDYSTDVAPDASSSAMSSDVSTDVVTAQEKRRSVTRLESSPNETHLAKDTDARGEAQDNWFGTYLARSDATRVEENK